MRTLAVEHNVLRFKVPVDDALEVKMAQGQCDLCQVETAETGQGEDKGGGARAWRSPGTPPGEAGSNTHQAVSSRKMPSRSRCVKSSPPATQTCQQLCARTKILCSPSLGFFLGRVGLVIPALPASQSCRGVSIQIQQTSTDAYSVPGPVLGEAGDTDEETQPLPSGCSV